MPDQCCPICIGQIPTDPRYPDRLCDDCADRTVDIDGRALNFVNVSLSGGFAAYFADDKTPADVITRDHTVFVDGVRCWADEAYFGGIVLCPAPPANS
jgi:hypothetical protein